MKPQREVPRRQPQGTSLRKLISAEVLADRLDRPLGLLGLIYLFVILGQLLIQDSGWTTLLNVVGWAFWVVFVGEFLLRAYVAGFQMEFWRRSWWQLIFLLLPFLRFFRSIQALRALRLSRITRVSGILSAGLRGSRSAGRLLTDRIAWLAAVTVVVILAASQLVYAVESYTSYSEALYQVSLATVTGGGMDPQDTFGRVVHVALSIYSVVVFATLAGSLGAYFLRDQTAKNDDDAL